MTGDELRRAFDFCLTGEARAKARACADNARARLAQLRETFLAKIDSTRSTT